MNITISYAIPVWNEHIELDRLLGILVPNLSDADEIIIQGDEGKVTSEVSLVVQKYLLGSNRIKYIEHPLNNNFAEFKNHLLSNCAEDYIFLIDADEFPHEYLLETLKEIISMNPAVKAFAVPRLNVVNGITPDYVERCGWITRTLPILDPYSLKCFTELDVEIYDDGIGKYVQLINPFDYQIRILKNHINIKYSGTVHEKIVVDGNLGMLPSTAENSRRSYYNDFTYCLFHVKGMARQVRQNEFYNKLAHDHN